MSGDTAVAVRKESAIELVKAELEKRESDLLAVLPPGMDVQRFMRVSLIAISKNPDLLACTPGSIIRSIVEAAEIGLEPTGSLNRAWLIPYENRDTKKKEAQLMIGYQGYADLMRDSGKVTRVVAEVVYDGDHFRVVKGTAEPRIEHEPAFKTEDPAKISHVYAIAFFKDGTNQFEVMTRDQVELIRARSRQKNGPTWTQNWAQMARKTAVRRLQNYVPLTARAIEAIARDDEREFGPMTAPETGGRTAEVREKIRANSGKRRQAPKSSPQQPETPPDAESPTSGDSAAQRTADEPVEGSVREVCGDAGTEVAEGETCALEPGHRGPVHRSADGKATWPVTKS
jgi:recombination protein RecT